MVDVLLLFRNIVAEKQFNEEYEIYYSQYYDKLDF